MATVITRFLYTLPTMATMAFASWKIDRHATGVQTATTGDVSGQVGDFPKLG